MTDPIVDEIQRNAKKLAREISTSMPEHVYSAQEIVTAFAILFANVTLDETDDNYQLAKEAFVHWSDQVRDALKSRRYKQ